MRGDIQKQRDLLVCKTLRQALLGPMKVFADLRIKMYRLLRGDQAFQACVAGYAFAQDKTVLFHQLQNAGGCGAAQVESAFHIALEYRSVCAFHKYIVHDAALHSGDTQILHAGVHSLFQLVGQDVDPQSTVLFHLNPSRFRLQGCITSE